MRLSSNSHGPATAAPPPEADGIGGTGVNTHLPEGERPVLTARTARRAATPRLEAESADLWPRSTGRPAREFLQDPLELLSFGRAEDGKELGIALGE